MATYSLKQGETLFVIGNAKRRIAGSSDEFLPIDLSNFEIDIALIKGSVLRAQLSIVKEGAEFATSPYPTRNLLAGAYIIDFALKGGNGVVLAKTVIPLNIEKSVLGVEVADDLTSIEPTPQVAVLEEGFFEYMFEVAVTRDKLSLNSLPATTPITELAFKVLQGRDGVVSPEQVTEITELVKEEINVPTKVSELTNDADYITSQETNEAITTAINDLVDGAPEALNTLKELADALEAEGGEIDALVSQIAGKLGKDEASQIYATIQSLLTKQDTLVSGVNIKTINGLSVLGSGDLEIQGGSGETSDYNNLVNKPEIDGVGLTSSTSSNELGLVKSSDPRLSDSRPASDVSAWAKAATKPSYNYNEIINTPSLAPVATSGSYDDLSDQPTIPTVYPWAQAQSKPSYTAEEVGALPDDTPLFDGDYNNLSNKPAIPSIEGLATEAYVDQSIEAITTKKLTITAADVAVGVSLDANTDYAVEGAVGAFVINSIGGDLSVNFLSSSSTSITLPSSVKWDGNTAPTISAGLIYNLVAFNNTIYLDKGR